MSPTLFSTAALIGDGATMTTRYEGSVVLSFAAGAYVVEAAPPTLVASGAADTAVSTRDRSLKTENEGVVNGTAAIIVDRNDTTRATLARFRVVIVVRLRATDFCGWVTIEGSRPRQLRNFATSRCGKLRNFATGSIEVPVHSRGIAEGPETDSHARRAGTVLADRATGEDDRRDDRSQQRCQRREHRGTGAVSRETKR